MTDTTLWKVKINNAGQVFTYRGNIIDEDSDFLFLNDIKEGQIKLNKAVIISMQKEGST
jgi:hypothetical protein